MDPEPGDDSMASDDESATPSCVFPICRDGFGGGGSSEPAEPDIKAILKLFETIFVSQEMIQLKTHYCASKIRDFFNFFFSILSRANLFTETFLFSSRFDDFQSELHSKPDFFPEQPERILEKHSQNEDTLTP